MHLVFVRHGKTTNHEAKKRQSPNSVLGETGKKQAALAGERLKKREFDLILTSPWPRAKETAEIIASVTGLTLMEYPILHEYTSNPILDDQPFDSAINTEFNESIKGRGINLDWRFRDGGESIRDVIGRAKEFQADLLTNHLGKKYLVVSHGLFIKAFIILTMLGNEFEDVVFNNIWNALRLENTSFTHIEYDEEKNTWVVHHLNDHSHLEEIS